MFPMLTVVGMMMFLVRYRTRIRRAVETPTTYNDENKSNKPNNKVLLNIKRLSNIVIAVRHGFSEANENAWVSSSMKSQERFGLTSRGVAEASKAGILIEKNILAKHPTKRVRVLCSPFRRTQETAQHLIRAMGLQGRVEIELRTELVERYFGELDDGPTSCCYDRVWDRDAIDGSHTEWGVESVYEVANRALKLVLELDKEKDEVQILVSHGDTLQILRTALDTMADPKHHRTSGEHLVPGAVFRLQVQPGMD